MCKNFLESANDIRIVDLSDPCSTNDGGVAKSARYNVDSRIVLFRVSFVITLQQCECEITKCHDFVTDI